VDDTACFFNESNFLLSFITDAIFCFINDPKITESLLNEADFNNAILTAKNKTIKAKNGNIELLLDVTEIGTVITVHKDI
jgi:hypothetical protein